MPEDGIWLNAQEVQINLHNDKVVSAYIQAYRIADKVIQAKGNHTFIGYGGKIHCGVRKEFSFTENGINPINRKNKLV